MTSIKTAEVVICGAGIAGISAAYHLAVVHGVKGIVILDPLPPLTMTSDKSTEGYRNWWPGPGDDMVRLMNRSIDIMEGLHREAPNRLRMHRRGYLYATGLPEGVDAITSTAKQITGLGAGDLRVHRGGSDDPHYVPSQEHDIFDAPTGADLILDPALIHRHFPFLTGDVLGLLHTRRCGWFAAQQFGMYMLEQALAHGVRVVKGKVEGVESQGGRIEAVKFAVEGGTESISTHKFIVAAGPFQREVGRWLGAELPVMVEPHLKLVFSDHYRIVPRDLGLFIWNDPVRLAWTDEERAALAEDEGSRWLLDEFRVGVHGRPEGEGDTLLLQWAYGPDRPMMEPVFPIPIDQQLPEMALRGMASVIPELSKYFNKMPRPFIDGGYYARTPENRPLIGPLPMEGSFIIGGFGGFGMQVSFGAGDLLARHVMGRDLPSYASAFLPSRYEDPQYQEFLRQWGASGQI